MTRCAPVEKGGSVVYRLPASVTPRDPSRDPVTHPVTHGHDLALQAVTHPVTHGHADSGPPFKGGRNGSRDPPADLPIASLEEQALIDRLEHT